MVEQRMFGRPFVVLKPRGWKASTGPSAWTAPGVAQHRLIPDPIRTNCGKLEKTSKMLIYLTFRGLGGIKTLHLLKSIVFL